MPKLTVMIPVYNVEGYVSKCLESVIYPDLPDYEILIVNDGSTDRSGDICREYQKKYPRLIRLIETQNGGLGAARDVGIDGAQGEYIVFLDSDDFLSPNALPEMLAILDKDFDICFFDSRSVNEQGRVLKYIKGCALEGEFSLESFPQVLFEMPSAWNKIYKTRIFKDTGLRYPGRVWYEDMYVTPVLYTAAEKMYSVHKPWHNYLQRGGSITNNGNTARNSEIIPAVNAMLEGYKNAGLYEKYLPELEYAAFYNQVLTSVTRVNLSDRKSPVQDELFKDFLSKFPDYVNNKYIKDMCLKYKLIHFFVRRRLYLPLNLVMKLNNKIKGK